MGEGEGGMIGENSIEIHTLPYIKRRALKAGALWHPWRDGVGRVVGGAFRMKGACECLWPIHVDVWQKPSHYCKLIILQLKFKNKKNIWKNNTWYWNENLHFDVNPPNRAKSVMSAGNANIFVVLGVSYHPWLEMPLFIVVPAAYIYY